MTQNMKNSHDADNNIGMHACFKQPSQAYSCDGRSKILEKNLQNMHGYTAEIGRPNFPDKEFLEKDYYSQSTKRTLVLICPNLECQEKTPTRMPKMHSSQGTILAKGITARP
ncbi:unnamed protein product [Dovyalis caffra]|uniref:Uncharacterized protein n=1 Tax=Dovyalis caffra TaxID=77055 RepID=A0AAV1S689_9ROSI|nr:unnamed protein product [Dovyalis caffra]